MRSFLLVIGLLCSAIPSRADEKQPAKASASYFKVEMRGTLRIAEGTHEDEKPKAEPKREAKPRFKGVELYSWKDKAGDWVFVLLDGTNRVKTADVVMGATDKIKGIADLKKALALLAEGEQVSWTHRVKGFEFPPAATREEIKKAAQTAKVELRIAADDK